MFEPQTPPTHEKPLHLTLLDPQKLLSDPDVRARRDKFLARAEEVRADRGETLRRLREEWARTYDPEEMKETLDYLLNALEKNDIT